MDGIDVALIRTDGEMRVERGPAMSFAYTQEQRNMLRQAVADAKLCKRSRDRPGRLAETEREITELNGAAVSAFLRKQKIDRDSIDVVGFHGQTVAHRAEEKLTVQLGDGAMLSELVRRPVVYDLRQNDVQSGGQGAPLASVYHRALTADMTLPVAVLNLGGVGNVTWIGEDGTMLAFDTGPGNAMLDDWISAKTGAAYDAGGEIAAGGRADQSRVDALLDHAYFAQRPPKSLDRNDFAVEGFDSLSVSDGAATLAAFTVQAVVRAQQWFAAPAGLWVVTGGGRKNAHLMAGLRASLTGDVQTAEDAGLDGDSMEAEAWAYLAVRARSGLPITFPGTTGVAQPLTGGVIAPWPREAVA